MDHWPRLQVDICPIESRFRKTTDKMLKVGGAVVVAFAPHAQDGLELSNRLRCFRRQLFCKIAWGNRQNGLATTNITMMAAAMPGTSFKRRNCLPVSLRSPRASFFA